MLATVSEISVYQQTNIKTNFVKITVDITHLADADDTHLTRGNKDALVLREGHPTPGVHDDPGPGRAFDVLHVVVLSNVQRQTQS